MLRSRTQLVKSHRDDLGLEYLWNGDEYGSLENSLKAMEKNAEYERQPEILALVHAIERPITVHYEDPDKGTVFGEFFTDRPSIQSVSWILAEFYFNRGLQRLYTGTCIILQKTINGFLCLLIVFLKSKTYQLILKDVIKLNRNLR